MIWFGLCQLGFEECDEELKTLIKYLLDVFDFSRSDMTNFFVELEEFDFSQEPQGTKLFKK